MCVCVSVVATAMYCSFNGHTHTQIIHRIWPVAHYYVQMYIGMLIKDGYQDIIKVCLLL